MGQTLSEPVTKKETTSDENHSLKVGASCMQGWRITMEDEHVHKLCLNDEKDTHFFAVFDGHGGQASAQFAAKHLDHCIVSHSGYRNCDIAASCKGGFLAVDEQLNKESLGKEDSSGCTAVSVLIKGNKLYCANAGDSRAVASVRGHAQLLSFDHKPNHDREMRRINAAGGFVEFNRVNGNLALSRALGDFVFKKNEHLRVEEQIVIAEPDVICKEISKDHEFVVLACDGIWDVLSNQDVVEFVRDKLAQKIEPEQICEDLMDKCLASECAMGGVGCDNMTVIIVALKQNGSFDELCKKCAVAKRDPIPPSCLLASYPDYVKGGISCL
uniref:protein-serine/threonine phosphatase n=1 Tax=Phallusia mammillata TaxID=59560 RepID=A0A6F9DNQ2_9ASCI|nr:probable protein phosphatase 2C T23F11.1 [Phallusia mammillata]